MKVQFTHAFDPGLPHQCPAGKLFMDASRKPPCFYWNIANQ